MARAPKTLEVEALPEADRLEPFPHPRRTRTLYGHDAARADFDAALRSGRCHHAWLMTGVEGIGKATLAYAVARFALAAETERTGQPLGVDPLATAARQVAVLSHPGLMVIRRPYDPKDKRFRAVITVDEVRKLKGFLSHKGGNGGWRVVVIDPIDEMNTSAANALLKSLEEPPPHTLFLMVCAEPGRLLPTIRSRCRSLALHPLSPQQMQAAAAQAMGDAQPPVEAPPDKDWGRLIAAAGGSVRQCLLLAGGKGLDVVTASGRILGMLPRVDWSEIHKLADSLAGSAETVRYELFLDTLLEEMARVARAAVGLEGPQHLHAVADRLAAQGRLASWAELWESIASDRATAAALNLDRRAFLIETVERLAAATR